jgi:hypothetical protein
MIAAPAKEFAGQSAQGCKSMSSAASVTAPPQLSIREIKEEIRRRAEARQAQIERGEYEVPLHYDPLSTTELYDLLGQVEYRRDFLELAVPPPEPSWKARISRAAKKLVCTCLRWLLIRQVEYNTRALEYARESSRILSLTDKNVGELVAAVSTLKLQMNALAGRLGELEDAGKKNIDASSCPRSANTAEEQHEAHLAYLDHLPARSPVLVIGAERGDFLRLLVSEGIAVQGTEVDPVLAEHCRELELPVICARGLDHLVTVADDSLGGIYLALSAGHLPPREIAQLLEACWPKLRKGGVIVAETWNPQAPGHAVRQRIPAELLSFLLESRSFEVVDFIYSAPLRKDLATLVRWSDQPAFDQALYGTYAIVGRR